MGICGGDGAAKLLGISHADVTQAALIPVAYSGRFSLKAFALTLYESVPMTTKNHREKPAAIFDDPYPFYAHLRESDPVHFHEETKAWFLLRYADVATCLRDTDTFSSQRLRSMLVPQLADMALDSLRFYQYEIDNMLFCDGERHTIRRNLASRAFVPAAVERLRPQIQQATDGLIDQLANKPAFDFVAEFSSKLPVQMICDMFAVPEPMRQDFVTWTHSMSRLLGGSSDMRGTLEAAEEHVVAFHDYIEHLIRQRRRAPGSDVLSLMIANQGHNHLSDHQVAIQAVQIIAAGHITTVDMLGNAMVALLRHPEQLTKLKDDLSLIDSAVEEMFRYDTSIPLTHRVATRDVEIDGKTIRSGDLVFPVIAAANRDPAIFDDPDVFDIGRQHNVHLTFISGPHVCVGAMLARLELHIAFTTLLQRLGELQLCEDGLAWKQGHLMLRGPARLHLEIKK